MNDEGNGFAALIIIGLLCWGSYSIFIDKTKHFYISDQEIKELAKEQAKEEIRSYIAACKDSAASPKPDINCVAFDNDYKYLMGKIKEIQNQSQLLAQVQSQAQMQVRKQLICNPTGSGQFICN
jgi:hypothetical protein